MVYDGETRDGKAHGRGAVTSDDFHCVGNWDQGMLQGFGILTFPNGDCFEGEFKDGVPNGEGMWVFGGIKYEG